MRKIILFSVIQQLLYHISRVESLIGSNFTAIRGGEFPFIASFQLLTEEVNYCGGALITTKHVITSSHCLNNLSPAEVRIVFEVAHEEGPALSFTAASWTTYIEWAQRQNVPYERPDVYAPAIVTLNDRVYHVNPVQLNQLTNAQLFGKEAIMTGRKNDVLSKATVNLLSDEDCDRTVSVLYNRTSLVDDRALHSIANPHALLYLRDNGSPLLHARDNSLLGIALSHSPTSQFVRSNFSIEFIRRHQVNIHYSVYYYRKFIYSIIPASPAA